MDAKAKRTFRLVFGALFIDLLAFTLILPLLPKILDYYAENTQSEAYKFFDQNARVLQNILQVPEYHNKVLLAGILGSWFSLLQFISSPLFGALSDRYGRRPILLLTSIGSIVSYFMWFMSSSSFGLFVLSRTVGGLCKANVGLSLAIITDVSDEASRGKGMAVVGSSFSFAFILGPLLGAYLSTSARSESQLIENPAMIAMLLSLASLTIVYKYFEETNLISLKDSKLDENKQPQVKAMMNKISHYINPRSLFEFSLVHCQKNEQQIIIKRTGLIYFVFLLFYSGLEFTLSFLTHMRFGFTSMQQGKLYLFSGILMILIQGGYIRRMKPGREDVIAFIGLASTVPAFIIVGFSSSIAHIYYSLILYSFSSSLVVPCLTTIVSTHSPIESRGVTMGTLRSIGALARALGPCLASASFYVVGPTLCYTFGALALVAPLLLMKRLRYLLCHDKSSNAHLTQKATEKVKNLAKSH